MSPIRKTFQKSLGLGAAYVVLMAHQSLWEIMFADVNRYGDRDLKSRALELEKMHCQLLELYDGYRKRIKDASIMDRIPFMKPEMVNLIPAMQLTSRKALFLLVSLKKPNSRPVYTQKIFDLNTLLTELTK